MRSRTFKLAGAWSSFLALFLTLGMHWHVLQSVAWARMLHEFSRSEPLPQAIRKTFDGEHPCSLCLQVRDGRQQQSRDQENTPWSTVDRLLDLFFERRAAVLAMIPEAAFPAVPFVPRCLIGLIDPPPKPPPRLIAA